MLPPDEYLIEELATPTYEITNGKIKIMKKITQRELLGRSPDRGDAFVLTFAPSGFFSESDLNNHSFLVLRPGCKKNFEEVAIAKRSIPVRSGGIASFYLAELRAWHRVS